MSTYKCSLLVVDDDPAVHDALTRLVGAEFELLFADTSRSAQQIFADRDIDLVLAEQNLPDAPGVQLLQWVREQSPRSIRLLMTGLACVDDAVQAINQSQVYRYVFKPWRNEEMLEILRNACRTFLLERSHFELLEELRQLNLDLERRVQQRTRELEETNHQLQQQNLMLQKLALTDPLTGLPNRLAMDKVVRSELRRRSRYPNSLALAVVDVDHFKEVNSRYLLPGGDHVLIGLTKTFISSLRTVDTIGRIGGEEFMVVAPETDEEGARILGERIRTAVEESRYLYKETPISVTVSIGFSVADSHQAVEYELLKHAAAAALQEAKFKGRNRCIVRPLTSRFPNPEFSAQALESLESGT